VTSSGEYRIGDADREQALAELRRAAEDGRLTPEELDARVARARTARTAGELTAVMADLRAAPSVPVPASQARVLAALAAVGFSREAPLSLTASWASEKRGGPWVVPPFLRVQGLMDTVRLDCLQARAAADVIDIEVQPGLGTVVLVLPDGWAVNADQLTKGMGTVKVTVPGLPAPGCPLLVVHGSLGMGTFKARPANRFDLWRLRRQAS
jgi:uncharacterized protein DUF1707